MLMCIPETGSVNKGFMEQADIFCCMTKEFMNGRIMSVGRKSASILADLLYMEVSKQFMDERGGRRNICHYDFKSPIA